MSINQDSKMDHFSISDLSRLTGVKPFTIRIWEKRYNALNPDRTEGNTRYYNNMQLRRLLNIVSLLEFDLKVSDVCVLPDKTLFRMIEERKIGKEENLEGFFVSQMISAGVSYDEPQFSNVFAQCLTRFGVRDAYTKVIYPMLQRMGILWNADKINASNEHFITHLLRQKVLTSIDLLGSAKTTADSWLLFLPEGEFHEMGLLIAHYLIRLSGRKSIYLGANLPLDALFAAASSIKPDNILFFFVHGHSPEDADQRLRAISAGIKSSRIYVAGERLSDQFPTPKRMEFLESVEALEKKLI